MSIDVPAMIRISVASYNGAQVPDASATFDVAGGCIGRGEGNRLVLADPGRTISRVHAEIVHAGANGFVIVNRGSNAISLNGQALENGQQRLIAPADELQIGAYRLRVAQASSAIGAASNPSAGAIPADWDPFATASDEQLRSASAIATVVLQPAALANPGLSDGLFASTAASQHGPLFDWEPATVAPAAQPTPGAVVAPAPRSAPGGDRSAPIGSVLSWTSAGGESFLSIDTPPRVSAASPRAQPAAPPVSAAGTASSRPDHLSPTTSTPPAADMEAIERAWREGLASEGLPAEALKVTPALMALVARLLREATGGTIDLLAARAALKREIRAEMTMIAVRENNPLKFSASVDIALSHLLGSPERGFVAGERAMREAYEDLRAHQFATLAGMRAALEGIFSRFDPAALESRLAQRSVVDSLLPAKRKARMWELFNEMYKQLAAEASDDFHELFGKAFLEAYEQHIEQLSRERP